ncbi:MAG: hypothetical protein WCP89_04165, partial [archaeon]
KATGKGKLTPPSTNTWGDGWVRQGDQTTSDLQSLNNFKADMNQKRNEADGLLGKIAQGYSNVKVTVDPKTALLLVEKYKNGTYSPENPDMKKAFDQYIKLTSTAANYDAILKIKEDEAAKQELGGITLSEELNKNLSKVGDLVIDVPGEGPMQFSSKEVYEYLSKEKMYQAPRAGALPELIISPNELSPREEKLYKALARRYNYERYSDMGKTGNSQVDAYTSVVSSYLQKTKDTYNKIQQRLAENLKGITGVFGLQGKGVEFSETKDKPMFAEQLVAIVNKDAVSKAHSYDVEKAMNLLKEDAKNSAFSVVTRGNSYYVRVISEKSDDDYVDIPVEPSYIASNNYLGGEYLHENVDMAKQLLLGNGSTNPFGAADEYDHAYYNVGDFGRYDSQGHRTITLPVAADLKLGVSDGVLYPIIKMKDKTGKILRVYGQNPQNIQEFETQLKKLTDADIIAMFKKGGYSNIEQLIN